MASAARVRGRFALVLGLAGCIATGLSAQSAADEHTLLEPGKTIERQLAGGQSHEYRFMLQVGQFAKVWVEQRAVDVSLVLSGPDGRQLYQGDTSRAGEPEAAAVIAEASGAYVVRVVAVEPTAARGRYEISFRDVEAATERHKHLVAAGLAYAEGKATFRAESAEAARNAIGKIESALEHWRAAHDLPGQATALINIGSMRGQIGDLDKALESAREARQVAQASHDPVNEAWALDCLGDVYQKFGDRRTALEYYAQALPLLRAAGNVAGEGNTLNNLGMAYARLGERRKAIEYFAQTIEIFHQLQDRRKEAIAASNMGAQYGEFGEYRRALESYEHAIRLQREVRNRTGEAIALNNLGLDYLQLGEYQKALDSLRTALEVNRDYQLLTAINLNNIARVYSSLGDRVRALDFFEQSIKMLRAMRDKSVLAHTLEYAGEVYVQLGNFQKALEVHNEALSLARATGNPDMEGAALTSLGNCYMSLGQPQKARDHFERALAIHRGDGNQRLLATTLRSLGALHGQAREWDRAWGFLQEALKISQFLQDRNGEGAALAEFARVHLDRVELPEARKRVEEALKAFESLRAGVISPDLRASFVASVRQVHELELEILARLHVQHPAEGFDAAALFTSERGRARSLLEMLGEAGAEIRRGVDTAMLAREHELQQLIAGKAEQQTRILSGKHTEAEASAAEKELDTLGVELEQVQSRIRQTSPRYATLTQPAPLDVKEIQRKVLDDDTTLLEYALGAQRSFLWAVTPRSVEMFELPARAQIEAAVRRVYELLTARNQKPPKESPAARAARVRRADEDYWAAAEDVSKMLLGAAASRVTNRRLLIVGEGMLQHLPFAALPEPGTTKPLIVNHEIVLAPSASVIAVLRQETEGRKPAEKTVAILADPVFSTDDERIAQQKRTAGSAVKDTAGLANVRSLVDAGVQDLVRLRFSRREAEEIARMAPTEGVLKALDFDASRETVLRQDLGEYRIVHFATHSLLNNRRPELSGVVLSLVNRAGRPQNGFLRLYDIYNLRLGAELVVLSACQTALGEEIKGEGLIGLTRGFLYAGAPRVVATLWEIDDRTTAEVMRRFYESMLGRGERPAAALRSAQLAMWKTKGLETPYYWAAFTLQGEWR